MNLQCRVKLCTFIKVLFIFLKELYVKFSSFQFVLEKYSIHQTNADLQQYLKQEVTSLRPLCVQTSQDADARTLT